MSKYMSAMPSRTTARKNPATSCWSIATASMIAYAERQRRYPLGWAKSTRTSHWTIIDGSVNTRNARVTQSPINALTVSRALLNTARTTQISVMQKMTEYVMASARSEWAICTPKNPLASEIRNWRRR
jgi:hypothetical protein